MKRQASVPMSHVDPNAPYKEEIAEEKYDDHDTPEQISQRKKAVPRRMREDKTLSKTNPFANIKLGIPKPEEQNEEEDLHQEEHKTTAPKTNFFANVKLATSKVEPATHNEDLSNLNRKFLERVIERLRRDKGCCLNSLCQDYLKERETPTTNTSQRSLFFKKEAPQEDTKTEASSVAERLNKEQRTNENEQQMQEESNDLLSISLQHPIVDSNTKRYDSIAYNWSNEKQTWDRLGKGSLRVSDEQIAFVLEDGELEFEFRISSVKCNLDGKNIFNVTSLTNVNGIYRLRISAKEDVSLLKERFSVEAEDKKE